MVTVSVSEWMDLPGYSLASDFMGEPELAQVRPVAGLYKMYLLAYALAMGLEQNFCPLTKVTQIEVSGLIIRDYITRQILKILTANS